MGSAPPGIKEQEHRTTHIFSFKVLGGAGVAVSAQYAVSKLYNDPLLRSSISLVASQDGKARGKEADTDQTKQLSIAVSSALLLAFCVGTVQLVIYTILANSITRGMYTG